MPPFVFRVAWGLALAMLALWTLMVAPLAWILRDGFRGADSHGWQALTRFLLTFWWGPIALVLLLSAGVLRLGEWVAQQTVEDQDEEED